MGRPPDQRLRADAQRNRDRLLEVAARAFARDGSAVTFSSVAKEAGVGIATLFRNFPTRQALVEAVYRNELQRLCDGAHSLLRDGTPDAALRQWMAMFVGFMTTKRGLSDTLTAGDPATTGTRLRIMHSITMLTDAGQAAGVLRLDIGAYDVFAAVGGVILISERLEDPKQAERLLDLLVDGLRTVSAAPSPVRAPH